MQLGFCAPPVHLDIDKDYTENAELMEVYSQTCYFNVVRVPVGER